MSIKCGIVGYGMGAYHCNLIKNTPGLEVAAVADINKEARERAAQAEGVPVYPSLTKMLEDSEVDLVVVVTPHDTHAALTIEALDAGRHVVCEKAMCLNVAEADAMIKAARRNKKMLSVFQNRRWDSDYVTVKAAIESGLLGEVFDIQSSVGGYGRPGGWRAVKKHGGGMLYDWGAHLVDQVVQMVPAKPVRVYANMQYRVWDVDVETQALVNIHFANGCDAHIDVGNISWIPAPRWFVRGEKGALTKQTLGDETKAVVRTKINGNTVEMTLDPVKTSWNSYYENIRDHLTEGAELIVKPEQCRTAIGIIQAAFISAKEGRAVPLKELGV